MNTTPQTGKASASVEPWETRWFECQVRRQLNDMPGAVVLHHKGMIVALNSRVPGTLGYPPELISGRHLEEFTSTKDSTKLAQWLQWEIQAPLLVVALRKDGATFSLQLEQHGHMIYQGRRVCMTSLTDSSPRPDLIKQRRQSGGARSYSQQW